MFGNFSYGCVCLSVCSVACFQCRTMSHSKGERRRSGGEILLVRPLLTKYAIQRERERERDKDKKRK